jgi:hypothetical protein
MHEILWIVFNNFLASFNNNYAAELVRASGQLRGAFAGGINIMHGVPFLLGGTTSTIAIRTMAEVEQWVISTMQGTDDISAACKAFTNSLRADTLSRAHDYILRLPASQTNSEKVSFLVSGFDNLKTAVEPMSEEDEKALLVLLLEELNSLYPLNLCTDVICDRFMEDEVFTECAMDRTDLVLIGASHLSRLKNHFSPEKWNIVDLTVPGWRINAKSVEKLAESISGTTASMNWDAATVIVQAFENSIYMVGSPGGDKKLPERDNLGKYHINGNLLVADKPCIKDLVLLLVRVLKMLGNGKKLFLTPLARYWVGPCCRDPTHHTNYRHPAYLPRLGDAIHALRDNIRDSLFTRHVSNFCVLCPNRMIGVGQRKEEPTDEEAAKTAALWGSDPVHPTTTAYCMMADHIEQDLLNSDARYTNPARREGAAKRTRNDLSLERASWVSSCSAATTRRDIPPAQTTRGARGSHGSFPTRGTRPPHGKPHRGYLSKTSGGSSRGHMDHGRRGWRPPRGGFGGGGSF